MQPINYDKQILRARESEVSNFQHFTDGFIGAMALIGMGVVGYQLVKLFISLFS